MFLQTIVGNEPNLTVLFLHTENLPVHLLHVHHRPYMTLKRVPQPLMLPRTSHMIFNSCGMTAGKAVVQTLTAMGAVLLSGLPSIVLTIISMRFIASRKIKNVSAL